MEIEKIDSDEGFLNLKDIWNDVLDRSENKNIFLTWEWLSTWWKHFGKNKKLYILTVKEGEEVIAIAPLMLSERGVAFLKFRKAEFIGQGLSDYNDFILTDEKGEALKLIFRHMRDLKFKWQLLDLQQIPETSYSVTHLEELMDGGHWIKRSKQEPCPNLILEGTWDEFYEGLSKNMRNNLQRYSKKLKEDYNEAEFEIVENKISLKEDMQTFFDLHQKRWRKKISKGKGAFFDERIRDFHIEIAEKFFKQRWLNLSFLKADNKVVSALYGFEYNKRFYYYLSGFDPFFSAYNIGHLHFMHIIKYCFNKKMKSFDFMRGGESYKYRWNVEDLQTYRFRMLKVI